MPATYSYILACEKKVVSLWDSSKSSILRLCYFTWQIFYEKVGLLRNPDASFITWPINLIRELDIFLLRSCHCPHELHYLNKADPKSWALEIKTSRLTSRETGSVCKLFRRAITRKTRRGRNFYHGAVKRPKILITRAFCGTRC